MSVKYFISYVYQTAKTNGIVAWDNTTINREKKIENIDDINHIQEDFLNKNDEWHSISITNFIELGTE